MSKIASHEEILEILSEQARKGSVTAAAALERALRARAKADPDNSTTSWIASSPRTDSASYRLSNAAATAHSLQSAAESVN